MHDFNSQINLAQAAEKVEGNFDKARMIYKDLINSHPDRIQPYYYLALLEGDMGNIDESIHYTTLALDITPFYEGYKLLSKLYIIKQDLNAAYKYLKLTLLYNSRCEETQSLIDTLFPNCTPICSSTNLQVTGLYKSSKDCPDIIYKEMYPAEVIHREMPKYIESLLTNLQKERLEQAAKEYQVNNCLESFVISVPDCRVFIKQGCDAHIITSDNKLLEDMFVVKESGLDGYPISTITELPREMYIGDNVLLLSSRWGGNFYHWLTWTIPRLKMIQDAGYDIQEFDKIIIDFLGFGFQKKMLEILGIPKNKIIGTIPHGAILRTSNLVTASLPNCRHTPKIVTDSIKQAFLKLVSNNENYYKRIYVSRNKAFTRRILNEDTLYKFLYPLGFKIIYAEDLTFEEQVSTFANAEIVVAPHGAGLVNLTFSNPGTKVLEIFNENHLDTGFFRICSNMGLDHYIMFGEAIEGAEEDITVDINKLKQTLQLAQLEVPDQLTVL